MLCVSSRSWAVCWMLVALCYGAGCQRSPTDAGSGATGTGESSTTAYENPASIAFEPLAHHPRLELSNLRFSKGLGGAESFAVDWKVSAGEPVPGTMLVVKPPGGSPMMEMAVPMWANETSGTIEGAVETFGFSDSGPRLESGCEMYLAALEGNVRHKISNSVTTGGVASSSARQATADELAKFEKPSAEALENLPGDVVVAPGTKLMMFSEGRFQSVTVVRSLADGGVRIKYDDGDFEGNFPRASLKIASDILATLPRQAATEPVASAAPATGSAAPPATTTAQTPAPAAGKVTPAELSNIPADLKIPAGTRLRALYANDWKPVTVLADQPDGKLKIHWDGYSDSWDEAKSRTDLRIETTILTNLLGGQPPASSANATSPSAELDAMQLTPGQKLEAQWGRQWLPVTVKRALPDGRVEIHWDGYQDSFDEALPLSKLRHPQ